MTATNADSLLITFSSCTSNHEKFMCVQDAVSQQLQNTTKAVYDLTKLCEEQPDQTSDALPELIISGFDDEQIWQQIELQNDPVLSQLIGGVSRSLVCPRTTFTAMQQAFPHPEPTAVEEAAESDASDTEDEQIDDDTPLEPQKEEGALFADGSDVEDSEDEEMKRLLDKMATENGVEGSDDEGETELARPHGEEEEEQSDREMGDESDEEPTTKRSGRKQGCTSEVDDRFFKLSAMEAFLDQEDASEEKRIQREKSGKGGDSSEDGDDVDMYAADDDDPSADSKTIQYDDFFDPPSDDDEQPMLPKKCVTFSTDTTDPPQDGGKMAAAASKPSEEMSSESEGEDADDILGRAKRNEKSSFEKRQEKLSRQIRQLETASLEKKPWQLMGEVASSSRPENSLLQEDLHFEHTTRPAAAVTEETTKTLEQLVTQRIKDKAWDDVVRKTRQKDEPFEYKKKIVLSQEKSELSLGAVYEQEYLKQNEKEEEKEDEKHEVIRKMMTSLFVHLDALSNFHYTPKPAKAELKVVSKQPCLVSEEVAPVSVSDAAMLAPEEITEKPRGELMGDTEKSATDKQRALRSKKKRQHLRRIAKEEREQAMQGKTAGKGKAMKELVEKSKSSKQLTIIKADSASGRKSGLTSSKRFFSQLQDGIQMDANRSKKAKRTDTPKVKSKAADYKL